MNDLTINLYKAKDGSSHASMVDVDRTNAKIRDMESRLYRPNAYLIDVDKMILADQTASSSASLSLRGRDLMEKARILNISKDERRALEMQAQRMLDSSKDMVADISDSVVQRYNR